MQLQGNFITPKGIRILSNSSPRLRLAKSLYHSLAQGQLNEMEVVSSWLLSPTITLKSDFFSGFHPPYVAVRDYNLLILIGRAREWISTAVADLFSS